MVNMFDVVIIMFLVIVLIPVCVIVHDVGRALGTSSVNGTEKVIIPECPSIDSNEISDLRVGCIMGCEMDSNGRSIAVHNTCVIKCRDYLRGIE